MGSTPGTAPTPDARHHHGTATVSSSRLKKREADRKAQRIAREKTKNRIAHLESLVEELSRKDDNATTVSLMTQLSRVTEQRQKLMSCLETTTSLFTKQLAEVRDLERKDVSNDASDAKSALLLNASLSDSPSGADLLLASTSSGPPPPPTIELTRSEGKPMMDDLDIKPTDHNHVDCLMMMTNSGGTTLDASEVWIDSVFPNNIPELPPLPPPPPTTTTTPASSTSAVAPEPKHAKRPPTIIKTHCKSTCSCATSTRKRRLSDGSLVSHNCWKAGNEILKEPFPLTEAMLNLEYQVSEDVPVHAVLHGWDSLAQSGRMTPLWKKVRQLDELCFAGCGPQERLAVLFMIHLLMRAYTDPTPVKSAVVPQWYLKSQLQQISPGHDPSADYFTWPALRYRFATTPHRYCDNTFWYLFREHLRIAWPFDFRDCYIRNMHLGAYGLSPLFKDRLRDLRAWTMEPDFFAQYPELIQDVPQFPGQPSPSPMNMAVAANPPAVHQQVNGALTAQGVYLQGKREEQEEDDEEEYTHAAKATAAAAAAAAGADEGPSTDRRKEVGGSHDGGGSSGDMDESEGDFFLGDIGIETNPEFLFFQEALCNTLGSQEVGTRLSRYKDSSCISL